MNRENNPICSDFRVYKVEIYFPEEVEEHYFLDYKHETKTHESYPERIDLHHNDIEGLVDSLIEYNARDFNYGKPENKPYVTLLCDDVLGPLFIERICLSEEEKEELRERWLEASQ